MIDILSNMSFGPLGLVGFKTLSLSPTLSLVAFNDPSHANAMSEKMARDFRTVVNGLADRKPDAVIVTGIGRAFSAGGDMEMIRQRQTKSAQQNSSEMYDFYLSFLEILRLNVPVIAAINGAAIGAGLCFACACDMRIAADIDRNILGFSFAKLGLTPGMGGTIFPRRLIGDKETDRMMAKGFNITPRRALEIGMVDNVTIEGSLIGWSILSATKLVERSNVVISKRPCWSLVKDMLAEEALLQGASFLTEDHRSKFEIFMHELKERG